MQIIKLAIDTSLLFKALEEKRDTKKIIWRTSAQWSNTVLDNRLIYSLFADGWVNSPTPVYQVVVNLSVDTKDSIPQFYSMVSIDFYQHTRQAGKVKLSNQTLGDGIQPIEATAILSFIRQKLGVSMKNMMPSITFGVSNKPEPNIEITEDFDVSTLSKRLTHHKTSNRHATSMTIYVVTEQNVFYYSKPVTSYAVVFRVNDLETGKQILEKTYAKTHNKNEVSKIVSSVIALAMEQKGYVDSNHYLYIPEKASAKDWDFDRNEWISNTDQYIEQTSKPAETITDEGIDSDLRGIFGKNRSWYKTSQDADYEGFFNGQIPEIGAGYIGTPMVDASQIKSMFGKTDEAIRMVNQFDGSLLNGVAFIFNFSIGGAYGVYLPKLDRDIKTQALRKQLESQGYTIEDEGGVLAAYHDQKTPEEVKADIDRQYSSISSSGGTVFGINMQSVLNAARQDATATDSKDSNIWTWMALLHLGGTIVHEAVHAQGAMDESAPEAAESRFVQWALPYINEEYKKDMIAKGQEESYSPLTIGTAKRHAKKNTKLRKSAQNYMPHGIYDSPSGSDLNGRFPSIARDYGIGEWSFIFKEREGIPIEKRLGRQHVSKMPSDIDQASNTIEEQLRKYTRDDYKPDPLSTTEELLATEHDNTLGYKAMETLLDETRPYPLMVPLNKKASIVKTATIFGWMSNLDITMQERVWPWAEDEEDFKQREEWIKQQPRYNPEYDIKGFYYRWIEPIFAPQLWDQMVDDQAGVHPAKRFASMQPEMSIKDILSVIGNIKQKISMKEMMGSRLVCSTNIFPLIAKSIGHEYKMEVVQKIEQRNDEDICAVWIYSHDLDPLLVAKAESYFRKRKLDSEGEALFEKIFRAKTNKKHLLDKIVNVAKEVCLEYNIDDVYIIGGYARSLVMKESMVEVDDINFCSTVSDHCIKVGAIVREKLGIGNAHISDKNGTLSFIYKGIRIEFTGDFVPFVDVKALMQANNIKTTPINMHVYNRDFVFNMMVYDFAKGFVTLDVQASKDIKDKIIRTFFEANYMCEQNPIMILRAIRFKARYGFKIDDSLEAAMIKNAYRIFDGHYSKLRLFYEREKIVKEGIKDLDALLKEYGLEQLMDMGD